MVFTYAKRLNFDLLILSDILTALMNEHKLLMQKSMKIYCLHLVESLPTVITESFPRRRYPALPVYSKPRKCLAPPVLV